MALYNVIQECSFMSDGTAVHYPRPSSDPVEVDDAEAKSLVEEGKLEPFSPAAEEDPTGTLVGDVVAVVNDPEPPAKRRPRGSADED